MDMKAGEYCIFFQRHFNSPIWAYTGVKRSVAAPGRLFFRLVSHPDAGEKQFIVGSIQTQTVKELRQQIKNSSDIPSFFLLAPANFQAIRLVRQNRGGSMGQRAFAPVLRTATQCRTKPAMIGTR